MAGVLEHKPGFYPLQTLLEEARRMGVRVLPPCLHRSEVKYSLETDNDLELAIRIPLTAIHGFCAQSSAEIVLERALAPFQSLEDALERLKLPIDHWEALARSGALSAFGQRRELLWQVRSHLRERQGTQGKRGNHPDQLRLDMQSTPLPPPLSPLEQRELIAWDFATQELTSGPHPLSFHRSELEKLGVFPICALKERTGGTVRVAGSVISRQRPPTAKGMCFIILEDETGYLPTAMVPPVYEQFRKALRAPQLIVEGELEDSGALAGNVYRSILIARLWPLDSVCRSASQAIPVGAGGHPGGNPRAGAAARRENRDHVKANDPKFHSRLASGNFTRTTVLPERDVLDKECRSQR
jgi:error-prone DNA polymerase